MSQAARPASHEQRLKLYDTSDIRVYAHRVYAILKREKEGEQGRTTPANILTLRPCGFQKPRTDLVNATEWHIDAAGIASEKRCTEAHPQQRK